MCWAGGGARRLLEPRRLSPRRRRGGPLSGQSCGLGPPRARGTGRSRASQRRLLWTLSAVSFARSVTVPWFPGRDPSGVRPILEPRQRRSKKAIEHEVRVLITIGNGPYHVTTEGAYLVSERFGTIAFCSLAVLHRRSPSWGFLPARRSALHRTSPPESETLDTSHITDLSSTTHRYL